MNLFIDTSGFLAVLNVDDDMHAKAKASWIKLLSERVKPTTNNYVLVETFALVQNRLGMEAVSVFNSDIMPVIHVEWVDEITHKIGVSALLAAGRKKLSLVDCVSFETMRRLGLRRVFTVDKHFGEQGFECIP